MIVVAIIAIIAAIAIPSLLNSRKSANERSAVAFMRFAVTVGEQYRIRFGRYPRDEHDMMDAGIIEQKGQGPSGYVLVFESHRSTWRLRANPEEPGTTGDTSFFVDQTGVIRFSTTGPATATSEPID